MMPSKLSRPAIAVASTRLGAKTSRLPNGSSMWPTCVRIFSSARPYEKREPPGRLRIGRNRHAHLPLGISRIDCRNAEPEIRTLSRFAFKSDCAAQLLDDPPGDGKAETGPFLATRIGIVARRERIEYPGGKFGRNAEARIGHREAQSLSALARLLGLDAQLDAAALGELDRVVGELEQRLAHAARIGGDTRQVGRRADAELQLLLPGARLQQTRNRARGLAGIAILVQFVARFALVARQSDDIVEQRLQTAPRFKQHFDMTALRPVEFAAFEQLRHSEQRVERRADFMADIGDECRFRARAGFRHVARGLRFGLLARQLGYQIDIVATQANALVEQLRDAVAMANRDAAEKEHEHRGKARKKVAGKQ